MFPVNQADNVQGAKKKARMSGRLKGNKNTNNANNNNNNNNNNANDDNEINEEPTEKPEESERDLVPLLVPDPKVTKQYLDFRHSRH